LLDSLRDKNFDEYLSTLIQGKSYIIPGIKKTNIRYEKVCRTMVPQGVCRAGVYLIVSAYDNCEKVENNPTYKHSPDCKSVLYIMDAKSGKYITTISIDTKCHVGALAYNPDEQVIYIADSDKNVVWKLPYEKIHTKASAENCRDCYTINLTDGKIDTKGYTPSFLTYYQNRLYVGRFAEDNKEGKNKNRMAVYKTDGTLLKEDILEIPYLSQGVSFVDWTDGQTYMLVSASHGRKNSSKLHVYRMNREKDGSLRRGWKVGSIEYPNMSEDIEIQGNSIYSCYESASNFYRLGLDKDGKSKNVVDRIMVGSIGKTIKTASPFSSAAYNVSRDATGISENAMSVSENILSVLENASDMAELTGDSQDCILEGTCGENLYYALYGDGIINITGSGVMDDYSESAAPWAEYKDVIYGVTIGADVDSVGANAFADCGNLTSITISEFSSSDVCFAIREAAFSGCSSLEKIVLPDKEYDIAADAFPTEVEYTFYSDAQTVADYCDENSVTLHTHSYEFSETVEAGCGNEGYDLYTCDCGSEEVRNVVVANDIHAYVLITETEATCSEQGTLGYCCEVCENYYETYIECTEHSWVKGDSFVSEEDGYTYDRYTCENCDETKQEKVEESTEDEPTDNPTDVPKDEPGSGGNSGTTGNQPTVQTLPSVGTKVETTSGIYKITKSDSKAKEVTYVKPKSKKKATVKISDTLKIDGYQYKVVSISDKAFKNNKKVTSVTIGKNVKTIGKDAFRNCTKLKKVTIKGTGLKKIGKNAFKNIHKKAVVKVPKKKLKAYKKLFKSYKSVTLKAK